MEVDGETADEVETAITVVQEYKDREPEVPLSVRYGQTHVHDPVIYITGSHNIQVI